jgi:hypothetical protein
MKDLENMDLDEIMKYADEMLDNLESNVMNDMEKLKAEYCDKDKIQAHWHEYFQEQNNNMLDRMFGHH